MNRIIEVNVGLMSYVYGELFKIIKQKKKGEKHYEYLKYNTNREKSFVFYIMCTVFFKKMAIMDYNSMKPALNVCLQFGISYRSYVRYIKYMIDNEFAYVDKNNTTLRLYNQHAILKNINLKLLEDNLISSLNRKNKVTISHEFEFKSINTVIRYAYIKYHEENLKKRILDDIKENSHNNKYFLSFNNQYIRESLTNKKAKSFNNLYKYIYLKTRNKNVLGLYEQLTYDYGVVTNNKKVNFDMSNKFDIINNRTEIRNNNNKKIENDKIIDILISKNIGSIENNIKNNSSATKNNYDVSGSISINGKMHNKIFISYKEYNYLSRLSILTPLQYYKLLNCEFNLFYDIGYKRLSSRMSLSKSQVSRILNNMSKIGITTITKRYVYISSVDTKNPRELLNNMNTQYSMLYENNENLKSRSFDRLIFCGGSLLYEIESRKSDKINIKFDIIKDDENKNIFDGDIIYTDKYSGISNKIYDGDLHITKHKYIKPMQQLGFS
jgi:hypothetical protein